MDTWFKNPWVIGGAALLVIIIVVASRGGSSASTAGVASQEAADAANLQLAGLTTQQNINTTNAGASIAIANLQSNDSIVAGTLSYLSNTNGQNTALAATMGQVNASVAINQMNDQATLQLAPELANINANMNENLATTQATEAPELAKIAAGNSQALATINAGEQETIADTYARASQTNAIASGATAVGSLGIGALIGSFL